jgi:DNA polymerase IIIc chi subunit
LSEFMKHCIFHDIEAERRDRRIFDIVEKAFSNRDRVLIYAANADRANSIDRTLWIIKQEAFVPHKVFQRQDSDPRIPVAIVTEEINPIEAQILILDGHCSLEFAMKFEAIHEFVIRTSPEIQEICRDRFRAYRSGNIQVEYKKD